MHVKHCIHFFSPEQVLKEKSVQHNRRSEAPCLTRHTWSTQQGVRVADRHPHSSSPIITSATASINKELAGVPGGGGCLYSWPDYDKDAQ